MSERFASHREPRMRIDIPLRWMLHTHEPIVEFFDDADNSREPEVSEHEQIVSTQPRL